jgi:hypothetical protein
VCTRAADWEGVSGAEPTRGGGARTDGAGSASRALTPGRRPRRDPLGPARGLSSTRWRRAITAPRRHARQAERGGGACATSRLVAPVDVQTCRPSRLRACDTPKKPCSQIIATIEGRVGARESDGCTGIGSTQAARRDGSHRACSSLSMIACHGLRAANSIYLYRACAKRVCNSQTKNSIKIRQSEVRHQQRGLRPAPSPSAESGVIHPPAGRLAWRKPAPRPWRVPAAGAACPRVSRVWVCRSVASRPSRLHFGTARPFRTVDAAWTSANCGFSRSYPDGDPRPVRCRPSCGALLWRSHGSLGDRVAAAGGSRGARNRGVPAPERRVPRTCVQGTEVLERRYGESAGILRAPRFSSPTRFRAGPRSDDPGGAAPPARKIRAARAPWGPWRWSQSTEPLFLLLASTCSVERAGGR